MLRVRKLPLPTDCKNFFIKFHVEVLPVATWRAAKGFPVPNLQCCSCGELETLPHVFVGCKDAVLFWHDLTSTLEVDLCTSWEGLKFLLTGKDDKAKCRAAIMVISLRALWIAHVTKAENSPKMKPTCVYVKSALQWVCSLIGREKLDNEDEWRRIQAIVAEITPTTFGRRIQR